MLRSAAKQRVSKHEAAPSFETAASRPPQDEAERGLRRDGTYALSASSTCVTKSAIVFNVTSGASRCGVCLAPLISAVSTGQ